MGIDVETNLINVVRNIRDEFEKGYIRD